MGVESEGDEDYIFLFLCMHVCVCMFVQNLYYLELGSKSSTYVHITKIIMTKEPNFL